MARRRRRTTSSRRKKSSTRRKVKPLLDLDPATKRTVSGIGQIGAGIFLLLAISQQAGMVGEAINDFLSFFFGRWGMLFPVFLIASGLLHTFADTTKMELKRTAGLLLCLLSFLGMMHMQAPLEDLAARREELAGAIGFMVSFPFVVFASKAVGYVVLTCAFLAGIIISFEPDVRSIVDFIRSLRLTDDSPERAPRKVAERVKVQKTEESEEDEDEEEDLIEKDEEAPELNIVRPVFARQIAKEKSQKQVADSLKASPKNTLEMKDTRYEEWTFPSFDLLDTDHSVLTVNDEELKKSARLIEEKLDQFDIAVTVRDARPGPTVTQFTLQPAEGVKLSRIANLKNDLALALAAQSLRIEAPIPGKSLVGIEMPNEIRSTVHLREILESEAFTQSTSSLTLPFGRDVAGESVVISLEDMPHLLIAGATGSGKSVCMNTFITALLFQNAPHELKFILIDPKRVELMPYDHIPHLLTPVITDAEKALQALRWAVAEMGRRLHRFSEVGARNIDEFNEKQENEEDMLPRIVVIIDELADLMMRQYRKDTETMIARIAQMARAVGMHLIIATQRPSVDVITGLIKANIPTRMAFRVVSAVDSRTIIDGIGAEDLLGKGDLLYMSATTPKPIRVQGIYISTKEVERVINAVKIAGGGKLTEQIGLAEGEEEGGAPRGTIDLEADDDGGDSLFFDAVRVVQETGKASASLLQRQLKVGYARAARLLDIMEDKNLIGPADGAKARKVYLDKTPAS